MTTPDKKKLALLGLLIILAIVSWLYVFRPIMMTASTTNPVVKPAPKVKPIKGDQAGKLDLPLLNQPSTGDIGRRNLFQFPPKPAPRPTSPIVTSPPPAFNTSQAPAPTPINYTPPTPPFKSFKYEGVSVNRGTGKILGALSEGGNTYQVKEGDCLLGQYCVVRLTEALVELEDVQTNPKRRQEFRRTVQ
jgi:hypothetical protein